MPKSVPLPAGWPKRVRSAVIHTMSLAAAALAGTRGWAAHHVSPRVRLRAEIERLRQEVALLEEELRLKDARMGKVPGHHRPHYASVERLAVLQLRAVRCWSVGQLADRFHMSPVTVSNWMRRLNEQGPEALVQSPVPLNKYPDYVTHIVQQLKVLCPSFGYGRIAHVLGREGLYLGTSTIRRMTRRVAATPPGPDPERAGRANRMSRVVARYPHHVWHCDLTTVPTSMGIWTSSGSYSLPPRWPFCWWMAVLADQYSAGILGFAIFRSQPTPEKVRAVVARAMESTGAAPRFLISDKGQQFRAGTFRPWCRRMGIRHLYGSLGQFGSIPFTERVIQTIKRECTQRILFPFSASAAKRELGLYATWYNAVRPHERLRGATPDEIRDGARASRSSGRIHGRLTLHVRYLEGRRHLPIVSLKQVA